MYIHLTSTYKHLTRSRHTTLGSARDPYVKHASPPYYVPVSFGYTTTRDRRNLHIHTLTGNTHSRVLEIYFAYTPALSLFSASYRGRDREKPAVTAPDSEECTHVWRPGVAYYQSVFHEEEEKKNQEERLLPQSTGKYISIRFRCVGDQGDRVSTTSAWLSLTSFLRSTSYRHTPPSHPRHSWTLT